MLDWNFSSSQVFRNQYFGLEKFSSDYVLYVHKFCWLRRIKKARLRRIKKAHIDIKIIYLHKISTLLSKSYIFSNTILIQFFINFLDRAVCPWDLRFCLITVYWILMIEPIGKGRVVAPVLLINQQRFAALTVKQSLVFSSRMHQSIDPRFCRFWWLAWL